MKIENKLFKERIPLLNTAMNTYSLRIGVAAKNIANVNTLDYKPERVVFEELFSQQLALSGSKTNSKHIDIGANPKPTPEIQEQENSKSGEYTSGENNINLDEEMSNMAETQIRFQFASQNISRYFRQLGGAITGTSNF